jgi:ABC-type transport system involved in cytochrome bd biosynthesis fused ATPase/permease subunit
VLVEIAAANAAFAIIKEAVQHSGDLMAAGKSVMDYFNAKSSIQKKIEETPPHKRNDLEEFFELERMKKQEQELKELMIYQGRPGLWDDWLRFQANAKKRRDEAKREAEAEIERKKEELQHLFENLMMIAAIIALVAVLIGLIYWALQGA